MPEGVIRRVEPTFTEMFFWTIIPALLQALAIFLGVFLSLWLIAKRFLTRYLEEHQANPRSAFEIVRERYARGEISRRDYEQMREDLAPVGEAVERA